MTAPTGCAHCDPTTRRLYVNGVPECTGCGKPCRDRFCNHVCEVKYWTELRWLHAFALSVAPRPEWWLRVPAGVLGVFR